MTINRSIFKAYDIRGVYPTEINEEAVYRIANAFAVFLQKKKKKRLHIAASRDNRLSSSILHKGVINGLRDAGAEVTDIGLATTPMFYFAVARYGFDGGIQVSASHNPAQWNGLKIVREEAKPIGGKTGLREILRIAERHDWRAARKGRIVKKNTLKDYLAFNLRGFSLAMPQKLSLVVDTANAVPGPVVSQFLKTLRIPFSHINAKLDGRFPSHSPDPLVSANLRQLKREVKKRRAALGVAFDGDGDRIIFCDELGREVSGDLVTACMASIILRRHPRSKIGYDIRSSRVVAETILKNGGMPIMTRVGHTFIKNQMRRENILFSGELSGHFYHRDHYFCEAPLFVLREILGEMEKRDKTLSELIAPLRVYAHSGELNFRVRDKERVLARVEKSFRKGKITRLDGVRIDFPDWWFLARPSNTEPLLRLIVEAKTRKLLEEKMRELTRLIQSMAIDR